MSKQNICTNIFSSRPYLVHLQLRLPQFASVAGHFPLQLFVVVLQTTDEVPHLAVDWTWFDTPQGQYLKPMK